MEHTRKTITSLIIIVVFLGFLFIVKAKHSDVKNPDSSVVVETSSVSPISIIEKDITEKNFNGTTVEISGSSLLAQTARAYVQAEFTNFKTDADRDVPAMQKEFGADAPTATYMIDLGVAQTENHNTSSLIITEYAYTGGANGNSGFKVFTATKDGSKLLSLSDVIQKEKQGSFTKLVKDSLMKWRPEGSDAPVIFPEEVEKLTFSSFANWSFDSNNLILYFSKYEIGPGALGAVLFPIPRAELSTFLVDTY